MMHEVRYVVDGEVVATEWASSEGLTIVMNLIEQAWSSWKKDRKVSYFEIRSADNVNWEEVIRK